MRRKLLTVAVAMLLAVGLSAQGSRWLHIIGAPVPGATIKIRMTHPSSSDGNTYVFAFSPHTDLETNFPISTGIVGTFRLDPQTFVCLLIGKLTNDHTDLSFTLPSTPSILGLMADWQYADGTPGVIRLSDDDLVLTMITGIRTSNLATGSTGTTAGWQFKTYKNSGVADPQVQNSTHWDRERMLGSGIRGYVQGHFASQGFLDRQASPYIFKRDRPARDLRDGTFGGWSTQHGNRVSVMRNTKQTNEFFLVVIDDKTCVINQVSGSVIQNASTTGSTSGAYGDYWTVTPDGKVICGVGDFTKGGDKMVLARLDGQTWKFATGSTLPGSNTCTLLLPIPTGSLGVFDRNTMVGHEVLLQGGRATTSSSRRSIYWAPLDGSALPKEVPLPKLGTGADPLFIPSSVFRASKDLKTIAFISYVSSTTEADVYAIRNISKSGITITNVSGFKAKTRLEAFWTDERGSETGFSGAISDDGKFVAFLGGAGGSTQPNVLYVAPTDGSDAGSLKAITGFPTGTIWMGNVTFVPGTGTSRDVVVFAGNASNGMDAYHVKNANGTTPSVTNLTKTSTTAAGTIDADWSFESDNGRYLYFGRDHRSSTTSVALDLVGIDLSGNPPKVFDLTGKEFSSGTVPSLELSNSVSGMYQNEFRLAPNAANEMYFIGRKVRTVSGATTTYFDENIYKFSFETAGMVVKVTNYTGSATSLTGVIHIDNLRPLSNGQVVYSAGKGPADTTAIAAKRKHTVRWHQGNGLAADVDIGKFARGLLVSTGTLKVVEPAGSVYWVQADNASDGTSEVSPKNNIAYVAFLDNVMKGHPLSLTGLPITDAGSSGNLINVCNSAVKSPPQKK